MTAAFIGIGSNVEPRLENCRKALERISRQPGVHIKKASHWYETSPMPPAKPGDPNYINGAIMIEASAAAPDVLEILQEIEREFGRTKKGTGIPRRIDLDILLFDDEVIDRPGLTVPHSKLADRLFVLTPLCDIAPQVKHPLSGKTMKELLIERENKGGVHETVHRYG